MLWSIQINFNFFSFEWPFKLTHVQLNHNDCCMSSIDFKRYAYSTCSFIIFSIQKRRPWCNFHCYASNVKATVCQLIWNTVYLCVFCRRCTAVLKMCSLLELLVEILRIPVGTQPQMEQLQVESWGKRSCPCQKFKGLAKNSG